MTARPAEDHAPPLPNGEPSAWLSALVIAGLAAGSWAALLGIGLLIWQAGLWGAPLVAAVATWAAVRLWRAASWDTETWRQ